MRRGRDALGRTVSNAEERFGIFARSSARQSGDRERARVVFFILGLPPQIHRRFSHSRRTRRGCFISTPVAIVPFVSQPALHASRRRAFSSTFSIYLLPTASLFLPYFLSPLLFTADPSGGRIDSTLSRRIHGYTFNARRRRIYSPAYFPHFDE